MTLRERGDCRERKALGEGLRERFGALRSQWRGFVWGFGLWEGWGALGPGLGGGRRRRFCEEF